jgi:hypothetical protein
MTFYMSDRKKRNKKVKEKRNKIQKYKSNFLIHFK